MSKIKKFFQNDRNIIILLFLLNASLIIFYRKPFINDWDAFDYNSNIVNGEGSKMLLGRPVYMGINSFFWKIASFIGVNNLDAHHIFRAVTMIFSACLSPVFYLFSKQISKSKIISFSSTILLITSYLSLFYSTGMMPEMMLFFFLILSFLFFDLGLEKNKQKFIIVGLVLFGISLGVRETALFYSPFLLISLFIHRQEVNKTKIIYFLIASTGATVFLLLANYFKGDADQLAFLKRKILEMMDPEFFKINHISAKLRGIKFLLTTDSYNYHLFYMSIIGLIPILIKRKWNVLLALLGFWLSLCFYLIVPINAYMSRHFIYLMAPMSISASYLISIPILTTSKKTIYTIVTCLIILSLGVGNIIYSHHKLSWINESLKERKEFGDHVYSYYPENASFMLGSESVLIGFYYKKIGNRPNWKLIWSGGEWPSVYKRSLSDDMLKLLDTGNPLYLAPHRYSLKNEVHDINIMQQEKIFTFKLVDPQYNIYQVNKI